MADEEIKGAGTPYSRTADDLPAGDTGTQPVMPEAEGEEDYTENERSASGDVDAWLLAKARAVFRASTDYIEGSITPRWETSLAHFNNQHAPGSRYSRQGFKRSNVFRPKTRANSKNQEANLAAAAFSTMDLVNIEAEDRANEKQILSAKINKAILQYRLSKRMPWFLTVMGAYQDTKNYGICVTHQYWSYKEDTDIVPAIDSNGKPIIEYDENGNPIAMGEKKTRIREDALRCDNVAPENFRFDPMCDWRDPAGTSPYLIYLVPMYAYEVQEMMETIDPKTGRGTWRKHDIATILAASRNKEYTRTRQAREGDNRQDPAQDQVGDEYTTVWPHMNIINVNGEDIMFWTLGTELILSEPIRLRDAFPHLREGQRPFTVGFSNLEAHKNYPAGDNELAAGLQIEINDIANQRMDNVKLALNKRYYVKRGSQADLDALMRNVPGGGVMVNDPEKDIKTVDTRDVTSSSYQEQDRLSVEMDELVGGFSTSSVSSNQNLSKTVGGMNMMSQSAGSVQDYSIRIFMETWMEPALRQLVQLIQMYETDEVIMSLAGRESGAWERYGVQQVTDELLRQELTVNVNIGIGNTDPVQRIEKLVFGVTKSAELPGMIERMKSTKVSDEIFGSLGYKDGSRFFMTDEEFAEAQQNAPPPEPPMELQLQKQELEIRERDNEARHAREMEELALKRELEFSRIALEKDMKLEEIYAKLGIEKMKIKTQRDTTALRESNRLSELNLKRSQGEGI